MANSVSNWRTELKSVPHLLTIIAPMEGKSFEETLELALRLLSTAGIMYEAAAHATNGNCSITVTLRTEEGSSKALEVLSKAGMQVERS